MCLVFLFHVWLFDHIAVTFRRDLPYHLTQRLKHGWWVIIESSSLYRFTRLIRWIRPLDLYKPEALTHVQQNKAIGHFMNNQFEK